MTPGDLTDWLMTHPPNGLRNSGSGSTGGELSQAFMTDLNSLLTLNVVAELAARGREVRVDAVVEWTPTGPCWSGRHRPRAPCTTSPRQHRPAQRDGASTSPARRLSPAVVRALNALPTIPENVARGCGAPTNESWTLRFQSHGRLLVFTDDVQSCGLVHASAGAGALPDLLDSTALDAAVRAAVPKS